ncbi:glycoside hydrolase family 16 protein [Aquimarina sp. MMG016]|uniref:glycoside hydrolase family 16 protein n=1 Tax=Aquimarina sp. MMG016 TaxID=2822690 RepID=UPI001B39F051|nr:glycoside hydrolase family 16 protein [Aquimarina sp. MMG016]MBQ4818563.1 glycoside hydrolase family 16 protein [Aquimarina sp. MMG016]
MIRVNTYFFVYIVVGVLSIACSSGDDSPTPQATCSDGIQNGTETGIDCGGSSCSSCSTGVVIPTSGFDAPNSYEGYNMVWSDEFNEETLSSEKWSYHLGNGCPDLCFWGNSELQYYTNSSKNLFFEEGNLVIAARPESMGGLDYTSSRIHTDNKFEFQYGRVDIRASMPSAKGSWVALWLLNHNYTINDPSAWWPNGGEIDIMEYLGEDQTEVFGTAHYGVDFNNRRFNSKKYSATSENFDKIYYVFSIVWEENKITWLVNDVEYHSITPAQTGGQPYPFNDEFYLLMNLSVGGNLPVAPLVSDYPDFLIIDYIRVYQKN